MTSIQAAAARTAYPGRGIVIGKSADGLHAVCAYFIMGRSENSRNRVFVADGDGLRTQAHDPAKMADPSLVIYAPVRTLGDDTIVTNGDQTDTIYDYLKRGDTFEAALRTREYEPDGPNWTPRISGLITRNGGEMAYKLSILKHGTDEATPACNRFFFEYERPLPGTGHFLHTYQGDGNPLPPFAGEPERVALTGGIDEITGALWSALDTGNKVSLFVRFIRIADGATETRILNKWEGD